MAGNTGIVQYLVSGEKRDAQVVRMQVYADKELDMTRWVMEVFQHLERQAQ